MKNPSCRLSGFRRTFYPFINAPQIRAKYQSRYANSFLDLNSSRCWDRASVSSVPGVAPLEDCARSNGQFPSQTGRAACCADSLVDGVFDVHALDFCTFGTNCQEDHAVESSLAEDDAYDMSIKEDFGRRLNLALDQIDFPGLNHGRTVELGKIMGVGPRSAANWLSGIKMPQTDKIAELCIFTKVSFDWLVTGREPMYPLNQDENALITRYRSLNTNDKSKVPGILAVFETNAQDNKAA